MLAEEFVVVDPASSLWNAARPLLEAALRLEQQAEDYMLWHGWRKSAIEIFLRTLPAHCVLLVGVWESSEDSASEGEELAIGFICEVRAGEVSTLRTLESLYAEANGDLPALRELEPGYPHAFALMRAARVHIAPVAWALFTDRVTWNEWIYGSDEQKEQEATPDKGAQLAAFAQQGRCVLLGTQTSHISHHQPHQPES